MSIFGRMKKRGISPIIATVLLVAMSLVLAVIIFVWARTFIGEQAQKFEEPVEFACEDVNFDIDVLDDGTVDIINRGNVPLYGIDVREVGFGAVRSVEIFEGVTIASGETSRVNLGTDAEAGLESEDSVIAVPIILGEIDGETRAFTCDDIYGITTTVI